MLTIDISPETEARLSVIAENSGKTRDDCARELIEEHIDDFEDRLIAESRLRNRRPALSGAQVRRELGLED